MKHERLKVLELLESGKITAEEATKLLEAMKGSGHESDRINAFVFDEETERHVEEKLNRFTQGVDNFTRDFGGRVESLYKDVEPKIKKASQAVLEKTAAVFDEIAKSLNETLESMSKPTPAADEKEEEGCCCGCESDDVPREN